MVAEHFSPQDPESSGRHDSSGQHDEPVPSAVEDTPIRTEWPRIGLGSDDERGSASLIAAHMSPVAHPTDSLVY